MTTPSSSSDLLQQALNAWRTCEDDIDAMGVQTMALLSIATSLATLADLKAYPAVPVTGELVAGGCCSKHTANTDDLLEFAFGLVCNADNSITSGGRLKNEWQEAARRFIDAYNAKIQRTFGGSLEDQLIQARAELAALKKAGRSGTDAGGAA